MSLPEPVRIVVCLEGGLIAGIVTDGSHPIELVSVDYDAEGADFDDITDIPQHDGLGQPVSDMHEAIAFNRTGEVFEAPLWVDAVFQAIDREDEP